MTRLQKCFIVESMKNPKEPKTVIAANITQQNQNRIGVVTKELHEKGLITFRNKTAVINKLLDLGYHTYRLLNPIPDLTIKIAEQIMQHANNLVEQQKKTDSNSL